MAKPSPFGSILNINAINKIALSKEYYFKYSKHQVQFSMFSSLSPFSLNKPAYFELIGMSKRLTIDAS